MLKGFLIFLISAAFFFIGYYFAVDKTKPSQEFTRTKLALGTVVEIKVAATDKDAAHAAIQKAFNEILKIDSLFSTYNPASPVSKINKSIDTSFAVGKEIYFLLSKSDSMWKLTGGAFDAALNNFVKAWGFDADEPSMPGEADLKKAKVESGWKNIFLQGNNSFIRRNNAGLNFGAIAKGYAVDKAAEVLRSEGIEKAFVNAGGEIKAIGEWIIGIQHPRNSEEMIMQIIIRDKAVSTSGDYEKYFLRNGKRYHHIFNPQTGMPADECQSVTIIADDVLTADVISTAVFVMGPGKGKIFLDSLKNIEGVIIDKNGKPALSENFNSYLSK